MAQDSHSEVMRALGRIEGRLKGIDEHLITLNHRTEKSEKRIRLVEQHQTFSKGRIATLSGIGAGLALVVDFLVRSIKG